MPVDPRRPTASEFDKRICRHDTAHSCHRPPRHRPRRRPRLSRPPCRRAGHLGLQSHPQRRDHPERHRLQFLQWQLFVLQRQRLHGQQLRLDGESNGSSNPPLKLKWSDTRIILEDSSTTSFADRDWIIGSGGNSGEETFTITDAGNDFSVGPQVTPFTIVGGAAANAFWLDGSGNIGLGTSLPMARLHLVDGVVAASRPEQNGSSGLTLQTWDILSGVNGFEVVDRTMQRAPCTLRNGAPANSFYLTADGAIGLGTAAPDNALHLLRADGTALFKVQETSATTLPRTLLNLQNNGRPEIVMGNSDTGGEWSFGAGTNSVLKQGPVGSGGAAKSTALQIDPAGNATLTGTLVTGTTTCGGGCDLVFSDGYDLPSIEDHAAQMFQFGHLPNVGPTPEGQPIDLTDKLGRVLNELEHTHLYIAELEECDRAQQAEITALRSDHAARIAALEARLAAPPPAAD